MCSPAFLPKCGRLSLGRLTECSVSIEQNRVLLFCATRDSRDELAGGCMLCTVRYVQCVLYVLDFCLCVCGRAARSGLMENFDLSMHFNVRRPASYASAGLGCDCSITRVNDLCVYVFTVFLCYESLRYLFACNSRAIVLQPKANVGL